jgi:hypothetical protein
MELRIGWIGYTHCSQGEERGEDGGGAITIAGLEGSVGKNPHNDQMKPHTNDK